MARAGLRCELVAAILFVAGVATGPGGEAFAQAPTVPYTVRPGVTTSRDVGKSSKTTVQVELLTGVEGVGLPAQEWQQTFEKLGFPLRIRRSFGDDKMEIREAKFGTLRQVTAIGRLERNGNLLFPARTFAPKDGEKLGEWLRELEAYGAQGAPQGQPAWGLSEPQFDGLFRALSTRVSAEIEGLPLKEAIGKLGLPQQFPIRWTTAATARVESFGTKEPTVRQRLLGCSAGTALATLLNDYGLGFRPLRTPEATVELAIETYEKTTDVWPIGWPPKESLPKLAPKMYQLVPAGFDEVPLRDVLDAVAAKIEIPVRIDHQRLAAKEIDLDKLVVSYPQKKTSWSLLLRGVTNPHKLTRRLQVDELGQPFVWITTLEPGKPEQ